MPKPKRKLTREQEIAVEANDGAALWWRMEGRYIDPDSEDVDWYDKRDALAQMAYIAGFKAALAVGKETE